MTGLITQRQVQNVLHFLNMCNKLKHLKRTGWVVNKVTEPETVASHMYRMSIMSMMLPAEGVDKVKCLKIALVHDLAECIVGDLTPQDNVSKEDKRRMEEDAMKKMTGEMLFEGIENPPQELKMVAQEILALWLEYEEQTTPESHFVKDLDRLDMVVQANEYETEKRTDRQLHSFFASCPVDSFSYPWTKELAREVHKQHNDRYGPEQNRESPSNE